MAENVLKIAQKKVKIPIKAIYVRETGNIFLGCEKLLHRHDLRICDLKHCPDRKKCRAYKGAKELKHSFGLTKSRRKKDAEEIFEVPVRKRRRKSVSKEKEKFFAPINQRGADLTENKSRRRKRNDQRMQ